MKQEIIELIAQAKNVVEAKEREIFENNKEKYTQLVAGYEDVKYHIEIIEKTIDRLDETLLEKAKHDLDYIIESFSDDEEETEIPVSEDVIENENTIDETTITEPTMEVPFVMETEETQNFVESNDEYKENDMGSIDFNEEELNNLLAALDSTNFDALLDETNTEM